MRKLPNSFQTVMNVCRTRLGDEHPRTLVVMGNMGLCLNKQLKYAETEKLVQTGVVSYEKSHGGLHKSAFHCTEALTGALSRQGKHNEAEHYLRILVHTAQTPSADLFEALRYTSSLTANLNRQKKYKKSENISRRFLESLLQEGSKEYPASITAMGNLASALELQQEYIEAEEIYMEILKLSRQVLGVVHEKHIFVTENFQRMLFRVGEHERAQPILKDLLTSEMEPVGPEDIKPCPPC